jgi:hypothetical protein
VEVIVIDMYKPHPEDCAIRQEGGPCTCGYEEWLDELAHDEWLEEIAGEQAEDERSSTIA